LGGGDGKGGGEETARVHHAHTHALPATTENYYYYYLNEFLMKIKSKGNNNKYWFGRSPSISVCVVKGVYVGR
jgi:hypothetical protein